MTRLEDLVAIMYQTRTCTVYRGLWPRRSSASIRDFRFFHPPYDRRAVSCLRTSLQVLSAAPDGVRRMQSAQFKNEAHVFPIRGRHRQAECI